MSCISGQVMLSTIVTMQSFVCNTIKCYRDWKVSSIHSITELISSALPHAH